MYMMYHGMELSCNICIILPQFKIGKYEKFYGWREKRCFAAGTRDALFAWLQDGTWVLSLICGSMKNVTEL
jgi:hypothetical protein